MLDWLRKELIDQYWYSNIDEDRSAIKEERINGRLYEKHGVDCATTAYALVYKVPVPGVKQFKFAILVGIARQNPNDIVITKEEGIETAKTNALVDPVMTFTYNKAPSKNVLNYIIRSYILGIPVQLIRTKEEILARGEDPKDFARIIDQDYYTDYYNDFKNKFFK